MNFEKRPNKDSSATLRACVCPSIYYVQSTIILILLAKWGPVFVKWSHFAGSHNIKGLLEDLDIQGWGYDWVKNRVGG